MKNLAAIAILVSVAAIGISLVGCLTQQGLLTLSEGIEIITLGGLILVTSCILTPPTASKELQRIRLQRLANRRR